MCWPMLSFAPVSPILLWLQPQCPTCPSWSPTPTHLICFPTTANWMALCYPCHEFDWLRLPTTVSQKWSIDQLNLHKGLIFTHRLLKNPRAIWEQMKDELTLRVNKNVWTNVIADTVVFVPEIRQIISVNNYNMIIIGFKMVRFMKSKPSTESATLIYFCVQGYTKVVGNRFVWVSNKRERFPVCSTADTSLTLATCLFECQMTCNHVRSINMEWREGMHNYNNCILRLSSISLRFAWTSPKTAQSKR